MWRPYGMMRTFQTKREDCTFDYFADAESFVKRFGHLLVESSFSKTAEYAKLSRTPDNLTLQLLSVSTDGSPPVKLAELRRKIDADVLVVGEGGILGMGDLFRRKFGTELRRALYPCQWIEFEAWFYARRPDQAPAAGSRRCGVQGLDCCAVYHGWAEKLEYLTDTAWDLPCDCGIGAALGCLPRDTGECAHQDDRESADVDIVAGMLRSQEEL
ncbi:unnamed protein product [Symbiodinium pilosum]|uniref:Uncharacterized protein n=1 Tax=Symbiodinium pilosum TaxID=2952 RepID=A0A812VGU5_SYMPI|nr:unnamed protein product [Symbiodinium pilosum]